MKIPKKIVAPFVATISIGILSGSVPMSSYAAQPEMTKEIIREDTRSETKNPVTEDVVLEIYGENGGGKASMDEQELHDICEEVASKYENVDASTLHAVCIQETRARDNINDLYPSASALGITQIEPSAHMSEIEECGYTLSDIRDNPRAAVEVTGKILDERIEARDGDVYKALVDYNMGPSKADSKFAKNPDFKWSYADNIMKSADLLKEGLEQSKEYMFDWDKELA